MELGYKSDIGRVRTINQDSYLVLNDLNIGFKIFAVADGLGGHNAGEIASKILIDKIKIYFSKDTLLESSILDETLIIEIIKEINGQIFQMASENVDLNGMGTTLTLVLLDDDNIFIFHVGDSRTYIVNEKEILQLTQDHSLVEQLVMQGEITRQEADVHPNKNILTRAIGTDAQIEVDFYKYTLKQYDKILLCTDGLTNSLSNESIKNIINNNSCTDAVNILVEEANNQGGHDNVTVIVLNPEVKQ
ncbi:MAG: Stp1/IreP family PP2C-type Ser/Thr phosphatase [Eubacteriaceae bacterium]